MHLNREHLACIEELQKQGEARESRVKLPQQRFPRVDQQLLESLSLKRPLGNEAREIIPVTQELRLAG